MFQKISISICILFLTTAAFAGTKFDFDGDGKADIAVFRPSNGVWYILGSSTGFKAVQFGMDKDKIVPADYDGDGKTDISVYRIGSYQEGNVWHVLKSSNNASYSRQWGNSGGFEGDTAFPADFDGDRKADFATFRWKDYNGATHFTVLQSRTDTPTTKPWGLAWDVPILADYDGDGIDDLAVVRYVIHTPWSPGSPVASTWYILQSSNGEMKTARFGVWDDKLVPADYDGDGKVDVAVYRPSNGIWYIRKSRDNSISGVHFGAAEDKPVPADYDGDGKADIAVWRPSTGMWFIQKSTGGLFSIQFGAIADIPIPSAFLLK